jgi:hypothetical protein
MQNSEERAFLYELFALTRGDTTAQVSMYEIGTTLGLAKDGSPALTEKLNALI